MIIASPPPWAQSGYGLQSGFTALALKELGHQVAISAYAGVHEDGRDWHGVTILSTGGKAYGSGCTAGNYARWDAGLLITVMDPWTLDPAQLAGLHVMAWMPIDADRLSYMEKQWLERLRATAASVRPVAMSQHGRRLLAAEGWAVPVVPHAAGPEFYPAADGGRAWRRSIGLGDRDFVITKVGVNNSDDRKSFEVTLLAFAQFAAKRPEARLYLHCEPQLRDCPNLVVMARDLGLRGRVAFAGEHQRAADLVTAAQMRGIYNGSDVLDATSKGEGFGVPIVEALACGTPVIGCRNSAVTEKISPEYGWLVGGQRTWARHHQAWWVQPSAAELARAYEKARTSARTMRRAAAAAGARYDLTEMTACWREALEFPARPADHARIFDAIYRSGAWGQGSGPGSDPQACRSYIELVEKFVRGDPLCKVLDLGCGDGRLARAIGWGAALYTGLDVVTGHDIRTCELPYADFVLIKDVFQHWPNSDIQAMLPRLAGYPRVLITNTISEDITGLPANADIAAGQWRAVDLSQPPFCWPVREILRWAPGPREVKSVAELS